MSDRRAHNTRLLLLVPVVFGGSFLFFSILPDALFVPVLFVLVAVSYLVAIRAAEDRGFWRAMTEISTILSATLDPANLESKPQAQVLKEFIETLNLHVAMKAPSAKRSWTSRLRGAVRRPFG